MNIDVQKLLRDWMLSTVTTFITHMSVVFIFIYTEFKIVEYVYQYVILGLVYFVAERDRRRLEDIAKLAKIEIEDEIRKMNDDE